MAEMFSIGFECVFCGATSFTRFEVGPETQLSRNLHACSFCNLVNELPSGTGADLKAKGADSERSTFLGLCESCSSGRQRP